MLSVQSLMLEPVKLHFSDKDMVALKALSAKSLT